MTEKIPDRNDIQRVRDGEFDGLIRLADYVPPVKSSWQERHHYISDVHEDDPGAPAPDAYTASEKRSRAFTVRLIGDIVADVILIAVIAAGLLAFFNVNALSLIGVMPW
jgi:hypothetical protein